MLQLLAGLFEAIGHTGPRSNKPSDNTRTTPAGPVESFLSKVMVLGVMICVGLCLVMLPIFILLAIFS